MHNQTAKARSAPSRSLRATRHRARGRDRAAPGESPFAETGAKSISAQPLENIQNREILDFVTQ
jgi:hypothetical protein